jgi:hypothetical protein
MRRSSTTERSFPPVPLTAGAQPLTGIVDPDSCLTPRLRERLVDRMTDSVTLGRQMSHRHLRQTTSQLTRHTDISTRGASAGAHHL